MNAYYEFFSIFKSVYNRQAEDISSRIRFKPRVVFDLCCGPGLFTEILAQKFQGADVVGVDIDESHIDFARRSNINSKTQYFLSSVREVLEKYKDHNDVLFVVRGAYHFVSESIDNILLGGGRKCVCIIERTNLSASLYPVSGAARARLLELTAAKRQLSFTQMSRYSSFFETTCIGELVNCDMSLLDAAFRTRSMSYFSGTADEEIAAMISNLKTDEGDKYPIFEEYRTYMYHFDN